MRRGVAAAGAAAVLAVGVTTGVVIASTGGDTVNQRIEPAANEQPATTTKPVETVPTTGVPVTLAPGFESYRPGDDLPAPAPAPRAGEQPQTVQGPVGEIYPDGYTDPNQVSPPQSAPPVTPPTTRPAEG